MVFRRMIGKIYSSVRNKNLFDTNKNFDLFSFKESFFYEYKVECKIGEGSFSEVLKCQHRATGKMVAAKQLKKHFKSSSQALDIPEIIALQKISCHPNILEMLESHFDPLSGKVTLIFELMDMSLYDLMKSRKRPVAEPRAKKYLYQIVKGVDHLHYHGVFHRDIKPENILIKGDKLKISDLGSIKGIYSKHPYTEYISTRWYRSPECLLTKGYYGPKMDVWAIGCVFFELLTLKPLFPGSHELDQISRINNVLGTPSTKLISRLKKQKTRNLAPCFPYKRGSGINSLIPVISEAGRDIFKQMLIYDPDSRINIRRLYEHKYFNDLREEDMLSRRLIPSSVSAPSGMQKRSSYSPMWLSYLTSTKQRKPKKKSATRIAEKKSAVNKDKSCLQTKKKDFAPSTSTLISSDVEATSAISKTSDEQLLEEDEENKVGSIEDIIKDQVTDPDKIPGHQQYVLMPFHNSKFHQLLRRAGLPSLGFEKGRTLSTKQIFENSRNANSNTMTNFKRDQAATGSLSNFKILSKQFKDLTQTPKLQCTIGNVKNAGQINLLARQQAIQDDQVSKRLGFKERSKHASLQQARSFNTMSNMPSLPNVNETKLRKMESLAFETNRKEIFTVKKEIDSSPLKSPQIGIHR